MVERLKYTYIFVILVYRNIDDLRECIDSIGANVRDFRIVVVNSFYDETSREVIAQVAAEKGCDFLNVENKGYSFGNNAGMRYAREHYDYDFIVVSNPDIVIQRFDDSRIGDFDIVAPQIVAADGRMQNPMVVKECRLARILVYYGFKWNFSSLLFAGIALNKVRRVLSVRMHRNGLPYRIYAAHGSFVLLKKQVVDALFPVYDERMFLFAEEDILALRAAQTGFAIWYVPDVVIRHKEDGSMKLADFSTNAELRKSNMYFYETYVKGW